ncbi:MAG: aminomethyl-transferring glycine dehydrogenase subunit GcvPA [Firmicutes bacterium]|nr:aminomethyl-transferring glycine dehydrogenase subunit GcvPA [Bacillota bacterium]
MKYIPTTPEEEAKMLAEIGINSIEELFEDIPEEVRFRGRLNLPEAMSEAELIKHMRELASRNADLETYTCFMGGGVYDRLVPAALAKLVGRAEFVTTYTPYQAEVSQGVLQSIYEFQSLICLLTGLDVANASVYDGATACAEAALMACAHTRRNTILLAEGLHPEYRLVVETYLRPQGLTTITVPMRNGRLDMEALRDHLSKDAAGLIIQQPNFFGCLEEVDPVGQAVHEAGGLYIACVDPVSLAVLKSPGGYNADIAVGEGQPLGNAPGFGGPHVGFMATKKELIRRLPGRIVGATVDTEGRRGYVLTLQAREQHIRRERATSNICSNQALNALTAAIFLALVGRQGLKDIAVQSLQKAHYAYRRLCELPGFEPVFDAPFFQEFTLAVDQDVEKLNELLLKEKIIGGLPLSRFDSRYKNWALFCVTEARTREEIDRLVTVLGRLRRRELT